MQLTNSQIQNKIISRLKNANILRYSQLQDKHIENDLFNYHLQFLVKKGFIEKSNTGYKLSEKGIQLVADPYVSVDNTKSFFKFNVINIVSRIKNGKIEILNQLRKSNPSYGKVGVSGGAVLKGELVEEAATRKLMEETGLKAEFKLLGIERRILYKDDSLFSDMLFPITFADKYSGNLIEKTDFGENFWVSIDEAIKNDSAKVDSIISIKEVLNALDKGNIKKLKFFFNENIQKENSI